MDGHIHGGMPFHASLKTFVGLLSCRFDDLWCEECFEEQHHDDDHEGFERMPELRESMHATGPGHFGYNERGIAALVNENRLRRILTRMLDENEFLSPYGIRALSRYHDEHPFIVHVQGQEYWVNYLPAESDTGMFGGNSNWRGPIWMPVKCGADPRLVIVLSLLRRQFQNRVSDRLGQADEPVRGLEGNCQPSDPDFPSR